jgi:hypothetical protein
MSEVVAGFDAVGEEGGPVGGGVDRNAPALPGRAGVLLWAATSVVAGDRCPLVVAERAGHATRVDDFDACCAVGLDLDVRHVVVRHDKPLPGGAVDDVSAEVCTARWMVAVTRCVLRAGARAVE